LNLLSHSCLNIYILISMKNIRNVMCLLFAAIIFVSCERIPKDVRKVLKNAGTNKNELIKVIEHYKSAGDTMKLEAAYFLIKNMDGYFSAESYRLKEYFDLLKQIDHLKGFGIKRDSLDKIIKLKIDSLESLHGSLDMSNITYKPDLANISSDFLIENIDHAFMVWNKPWAKHVNFADFCEFILPYRIYNEPLRNWREYFYNELITFQDSVKDKTDPKELILKISNYLYKRWNHLDNFTGYNFYPDPVEMAKCNGGTCDYRYYLITCMLRSVGLPVSIEFTPQWTSYSGGHSWNAFLDTNGKIRPFNGAEDNTKFFEKNLVPLGDGGYLCTKVYRYTFAHQKESLPFVTNDADLPQLFKNSRLIDVTFNYDIPKTKYAIEFEDNRMNNKIVYLCCYDYGYDMNYIAWSKVKNKKVDFNFIGVPAFYMPVVIEKGENRLIHSPFVGTIDEIWRHDYNPDLTKRGSVRLYRKFNFSEEFKKFAQGMIKSRFQGSNKADFTDAEDLDTVTIQAKAFEELVIHNPRKFRYLRYLSNDSADVRVAEIEFWGKENQKDVERKMEGQVIGKANGIDYENNADFNSALDGNIRTNFNAKPGSWVGIDLGQDHKAQITKVWFLPRNNYNEIENGHVYELFYLDQTWKSLGKKTADKHYLIYDDVPVEALLLLKNLTDGKQERIFVYDTKNSEQVWW
jgi:hypothetical protein